MHSFDYVIVGSGIAGLSFALKAAKFGRVAIVTKKEKATTNTAWAQGGIASVTDRTDSFDAHVRDTLIAGADLCSEEIVRSIVADGPERIRELMQIGVGFDQNPDGTPDLTREGGHSARRILHARDATGREIERALLDAVASEKNITLLENHMAVDLLTHRKLGLGAVKDRVLGLYVLSEKTGEVITIRTDRVILATGGCGKVYLYTTNPNIATGDGVAIAWRAGAKVSNMEFIQFHPTCLFHPSERNFLISEAVRGEGGKLIGRDGVEFMHRYDERGALAPRDIVARAIDAEMKRTGAPCVFVDIRHRGPEFIRSHFPTIYERCLSLGIDITKQPIPVVPAAHYQCGGVETDASGKTSLPGLYAVGEVACTGLHGANRLASNSLLEAVVVAHRAAEALTAWTPPLDALIHELPEWKSGDAHDVDELVVIYHNWDEIHRLMWDYVGIVRTDKRLQRASARLRNLAAEVQEFYWDFKVNTDLLELRNLVTVASLIVDSALLRKESRGLHYNLDYHDSSEAFRRPTVLQRV